jgi:hypothetical protein
MRWGSSTLLVMGLVSAPSRGQEGPAVIPPRTDPTAQSRVSAPAGYGYSVDFWDGNLYLINLSTGTATLIGPVASSPAAAQVSGLTAGSDQFLYGVSEGSDTLMRIDPATGAGTTIGPLGVDASSVGLTFDGDGNLWMATDAPTKLYRVDPVTGAATLTATAATNRTYGLAASASGILYGLERSGGELVLTTIDPWSGTFTSIGPLGTLPGDAGLDFDANGTLWAILTSGGLVTIDTATGVATPGPHTLGPRNLAITSIPPSAGRRPGSVRFAQSGVSVAENAGLATVALVREGGLAETRVDVLVRGGSAESPDDFQGGAIRTIIPAGRSAVTAQIPIIDDALVEAAETVSLELIALGPGLTKAQPDTAVLTIVDDDVAPLPASVTLTVRQTGAGFGRLVGSPGNIACGDVCDAEYASGAVVTLAAIPDAQSNFAGWRGDSDCVDGSVTMTASRSCIAAFSHVSTNHVLDVNADARGDVWPYPLGTLIARGAEFNGDQSHEGLLYDVVTGALTRAENGPAGLTLTEMTVGPQQTLLAIDLDGDSRSDIFIYDPATGGTSACIAALGFACLPGGALPAGREVHPVYFDRNGRTDLFLYDGRAGVAEFFVTAEAALQFTLGASVVPSAPGHDAYVSDLDGDGRSDVLLYDRVSGEVAVVQNTEGGLGTATLPGPAGLVLRVANLDGDSSNDLIAYDPVSGQTLQLTSRPEGGGFGLFGLETLPAGRRPFTTDLNGDGRGDLLLYDPASGALTKAVTRPTGGFSVSNETIGVNLTLLAGFWR